MNEIVIVGASIAGVRSAEALRRDGYTGHLTLVGAETHFPPYDRPPLSKEILSGEWGLERGRLRIADDLEVELRLGVRAEHLDLAAGSIALGDGSKIDFDGLVVATGAAPRMLPGLDPTRAGVHVLRSFEDCVALRSALEAGRDIVVIGAGFIGAEVAAVCRERGLHVTVVELFDWPMERALGPVLGAWAAELHASHGVELRMGIGVEGVTGEDHVESVVLSDGSSVHADAVVVAIGVAPETDWLEGSGLTIDNGLLLDATCRALGADNVVGAGDVARWHNPTFDRVMRVEHWANAVEQADAASRTLLASPAPGEPFASVPYFWSDQYDKKIQYVGIGGDFAGILEGALDEHRFVAGFASGDRLVGALCVNFPVRMVRYRRAIAAGISLADAQSGIA